MSLQVRLSSRHRPSRSHSSKKQQNLAGFLLRNSTNWRPRRLPSRPLFPSCQARFITRKKEQNRCSTKFTAHCNLMRQNESRKVLKTKRAQSLVELIHNDTILVQGRINFQTMMKTLLPLVELPPLKLAVCQRR